MKSPFTYFGGKTTLADAIAGLLPAHDHYVEPFGGSLAVLLAKPPARMETVNDLDADIMTFWRVLRDRPDDLARVCALTPHARLEHAAARAEDLAAVTDELERARRVWVLLTQTRSSTMRRTGWRHYQDPKGTSAGMPRYLEGYVERMPPAAGRLIGVTLEARPGLDLIRAYGRHEDVLLYCDPPYLGSTRARNYRHEMTTVEEHRELADALHAARAAVVLSGYHSPLYDELYDGWHRVEISSFTGNANRGTGARTEVLWSNRALVTDSEGTLFSEASA
ncbi:MAG TPA: DNA adenine methylase [Mycobacterium sp.]|nr:DNA adenine methylase [Mycobacterium sp.]